MQYIVGKANHAEAATLETVRGLAFREHSVNFKDIQSTLGNIE
jgi:hypothetical protein